MFNSIRLAISRYTSIFLENKIVKGLLLQAFINFIVLKLYS